MWKYHKKISDKEANFVKTKNITKTYRISIFDHLDNRCRLFVFSHSFLTIVCSKPVVFPHASMMIFLLNVHLFTLFAIPIFEGTTFLPPPLDFTDIGCGKYFDHNEMCMIANLFEIKCKDFCGDERIDCFVASVLLSNALY